MPVIMGDNLRENIFETKFDIKISQTLKIKFTIFLVFRLNRFIDGSRAVYPISPNCSFPQISK